MELPSNFTLFDTAADVVIRFRGQVAYKSRENALRALARRVPDASQQNCDSALEFLSEKFDVATTMVAECLANDRLSFEDCRDSLSAETPPVTWKAIHDILSWAIYHRTR
jgi:hypothetical protein